MIAVPFRVYVALAIGLSLGGSHYYAYIKGAQSEKAKQDGALARALVEQMKRAQMAETATELAKAELMALQARRQQEIEAATDGTKQRIRTIYRDRPVPAECHRPDGVREELQGAIARANAAARGL